MQADESNVWLKGVGRSLLGHEREFVCFCEREGIRERERERESERERVRELLQSVE